MLKEFRDFINRGNVLDLAVAVIIGAAFTGIVNSLVNDIITPILGILLGGVNFAGLSITVGEAVINYGNFIQAIINFLIVAWVIFLIVRSINQLQKKRQPIEEVAPPPPPEPPAEVKLLTEIRDLLKEQVNG
ncbi:MAG: large conductance mechanosensitive channel protein MscL [Anaerolineales bacterium]|nr:large conductance mechanosensitive channel protein MscL [Anaerolineales bacterium]